MAIGRVDTEPSHGDCKQTLHGMDLTYTMTVFGLGTIVVTTMLVTRGFENVQVSVGLAIPEEPPVWR